MASTKFKRFINFFHQSRFLTGLLGSHSIFSSSIETSWRLHGQDIDLPQALPLDQLKAKKGNIVIFVHGLMLDERIWTKAPGARTPWGIHFEEGKTGHPIYVRYNTGRAVQHLALEFAGLLKELENYGGRKINSIDIIAFSMGGLVTRGALHFFQKSKYIRNVFLVSVPNEGAYLAKFAEKMEDLLARWGGKWPFIVHKLLGFRSESMKQLSNGLQLLDDNEKLIPAQSLTWPKKTKFFIAAGSLIPKNPSQSPLSMGGDGMVARSSAAGGPWAQEALRKNRFKIYPRSNHFTMPWRKDILKDIEKWRQD